MRMNSRNRNILIQIALICLWATELIRTDAYYVNYLFLAVIGVICTIGNASTESVIAGNGLPVLQVRLIRVFSVLYSLMAAAANFGIWRGFDGPPGSGAALILFRQIICIALLLSGGYVTFRNILCCLSANLERLIFRKDPNTLTPKRIFLMTFVLLTVTRCIFLFFCQYPGIVKTDCMDQIYMILGETSYSNHHPFYHTMLIRFWFMIGWKLFHEINAAIAVYSCFQIVFSSFCFSFAVSTAAHFKTPKKILLLISLLYILLPYHLSYAINMYKDAMFAFTVFLFIVCVFRCMNRIGKPVFEYFLLVISCFGFCLFRSNGFFAFAVLTIIFALLFRTKYLKLLIIFACITMVSYVMKHQVLSYLHVRQPDIVEVLSIPEQQIARAIVEGCELNEWERQTLGAVVDIERIPDAYKPFISDPIKNLVRAKDQKQLIEENPKEYLKLYLSIGQKSFGAYVRGWIDETRGYWNAGYDYWYFSRLVEENPVGIVSTARLPLLDQMIYDYCWLFRASPVLQLFVSIGLFTWIDMAALFIAIRRKDKTGIFITLPVLTIVLSLLVATPVFSEFRYAYASFCAFPFVLAVVLRPIHSPEETSAASDE